MVVVGAALIATVAGGDVHTSAKCLELLSMPPPPTFTASPLESPQMAIKQSSLAQIACGSPTAGRNAIDHSPPVPEK